MTATRLVALDRPSVGGGLKDADHFPLLLEIDAGVDFSSVVLLAEAFHRALVRFWAETRKDPETGMLECDICIPVRPL